MILPVARAKKDAKAISHALGFPCETLGGIRNPEDINLAPFKDKIPFFFFGESEKELAFEIGKKIRKITPLYQIILLKKKAVRNARLSEIIEAFERAKAKLRLGINFNKVFLFSPENEFSLEIHPDYDSYFVLGKGFVENLEKICNLRISEGALVLRKLYGEEAYFTPFLKGTVIKKTGTPLEVKILSEKEPEKIEVSLMIEKNRAFLEAFEKIIIWFLQEKARGKVLVPFSGGKDSLACLILAKKALSEPKALFVETNFDLPQLREYVESVCDRLKVPLIVKRVNFDIDKNGFPTFENRWCTNLKINTIEEVVREERIDTLIVGDRDGESRMRRMRPEVMEKTFGEREILEVFPLKYLSGGMVQLYILLNGFSLNPFYYQGFYRLGCTICPFLSEWEKLLMKHFLNPKISG